jgi:hypothetical protein
MVSKIGAPLPHLYPAFRFARLLRTDIPLGRDDEDPPIRAVWTAVDGLTLRTGSCGAYAGCSGLLPGLTAQVTPCLTFAAWYRHSGRRTGAFFASVPHTADTLTDGPAHGSATRTTSAPRFTPMLI